MPLSEKIKRKIAMVQNGVISELDLSEEGLDNNDILELVELIEKSGVITSIQYFNLYRNNIGDAGAKALARLDEKIQNLNLSYNDLHDQGAKILINSKIPRINLSDNALSNETAVFFLSHERQIYFEMYNNRGVTSDHLEEINEKLRFFQQNGVGLFNAPLHTAPYSCSNNQENTRESTQILRGELLESFDELILGELEMLIGIQNAEDKKLLLNALFDEHLSTPKIALFSSEIDPILGNRLAILYCCLHPNEWSNPYMQKFKQTVLTSYVERLSSTQESSSKLFEKETWLAQHARALVSDFLRKKKFSLQS